MSHYLVEAFKILDDSFFFGEELSSESLKIDFLSHEDSAEERSKITQFSSDLSQIQVSITTHTLLHTSHTPRVTHSRNYIPYAHTHT